MTNNEMTAPKGHPKGLYILFSTEMWERFNFYGMRAMLMLFMIKALAFKPQFASNLYGSYLSLIYLTPLLGGFMADRFWGNRRSIIIGGLVMAAGEIILFICGSVYATQHGLATFLYFCGLGFMIAGNGFFKPNISSLVGQLYPHNDHRKDAAYTIFYMGINTGGALGPFICGLFGDTGNPVDFRWAFLIAGIGMVISVIVQKLFHHKYVKDPAGRILGLIPGQDEKEETAPGPDAVGNLLHIEPAPRKTVPKYMLNPVVTVIGLLVLAACCIGLLYLDTRVNYLFYLLIACIVIIPAIIFADKTLTAVEKRKVIVIYVVCFFVIFFWAAFEQAGASLTLFADAQTDRTLKLHIPVWAVVLVSALLLFFIFRLFRKAAKNLASEYDKTLRYTVFGLLALFAAAILLANGYLLSQGQQYVSLKNDEVPASWFQSLNSVFVVSFAPFFAWLWLKLGKKEPASPTKMALGLLLLGLGYLWIATGVDNVQPTIKVSMIWLTGMYALHTCGELCLSPIGMSLVNKLSPLKFSSLLMAIWFTANAFGNKLAGVLSALYPEDKPTSFLGYTMHNLHDFFMLFVVMSIVASGLLFLLTKRLQKMMYAE